MKLLHEHLEDSVKYMESWMNGYSLVEGGTYTGKSIKFLLEAFQNKGIVLKNAWCFDSWKGLPDNLQDNYMNPDWRVGSFDSREWHNVELVEEVINKLSDFHKHLVPKPVYVSGWFKDTLNERTIAEHGIEKESICWAHVDADIYSSSLEFLEFLFKYKLLCKMAIIRFDDIQSTPQNAGQWRAWNETVDKYNVITVPYSMNFWRILNYDQ